jgi:membrane-associated protease RseP (regulator of RpoE activity)
VTDTQVTNPPAAAPPPHGEIAGGAWRLLLLAAAVVALGVFAGRGWLLIVSALTIMIFLHELGHFITAKRTGMKVTQFFLGIGPKLWSFQRGETEYGVKLIPVAAYVRIIGMNNLDDTPSADEPRTYRQQSFPKRMLVITAGSMMHFLQALVLFVVVFSFVGVPRDSDLAQRFGAAPPSFSVSGLIDGGAAGRAGIQKGDRIVGIDDSPVKVADDIGPLIAHRVGDRITVVVEREGHRVSVPLTVGRNPQDRTRGFLGVEMRDEDLSKLPAITTNPANGMYQSALVTGTWIGRTAGGLGQLVTGGVGHLVSNVANSGDRGAQGPVVSGPGNGDAPAVRSTPNDENRIVSIYGVARIGANASENSMADFLLLLALVNISIGVLNLVPLLPLDGGHAAIAIYERIRSRHGRRHMADVSRLLPLTYAVVLVLGTVMLSSIYMDIVDPIGLR